MSEEKEVVSEQDLAKIAKSDLLVSLNHQSEQVEVSVSRMLESLKRDDFKRSAYWGGVAARKLSDLVKETLETFPKKRIIT